MIKETVKRRRLPKSRSGKHHSQVMMALNKQERKTRRKSGLLSKLIGI